jgi:hypothetical protein
LKIIREYINEKFTQYSDPVHDMGIGIYIYHEFKNESEAFKFLCDNLDVIINVSNPLDLLWHNENHYINPIYYRKLNDFCKKYNNLPKIGYSKNYPIDPAAFEIFILKNYNK